MEGALEQNVEILTDELEPKMIEVPVGKPKEEPVVEMPTPEPEEKKQLINCLKKVKVCVRFIPKEDGKITNPKHVLYGKMAENAKRTFVVPRLSSGVFVNVLTDAEKDFLEFALGLKKNDLSIYKKENNFWSTATKEGIAFVELRKQDNYFDLSNPIDYIKVKILLANKDLIAPSLNALQDRPKATYQFVIINEGEEAKASKSRMDYTMQCYKEYGKVETNIEVLRFIISSITGKDISRNTPLEILQTKINGYIQSDPKNFLRIILDPLRDAKVLVIKAADAGMLARRGSFYYVKEGDTTTPMCENGEEPTLSIAAKWITSPRRQEFKFNLEDKLDRQWM